MSSLFSISSIFSSSALKHILTVKLICVLKNETCVSAIIAIWNQREINVHLHISEGTEACTIFLLRLCPYSYIM